MDNTTITSDFQPKDYQLLRQAIGEELNRSSQSFVRIGFLLRVAKDTDVLRDSGYKNVNEFAKGEFGLEESQTSRFMAINKKFSEGGYSDKLQIGFQNHGWSKLSIMLTLPDSIAEEISSEYSKAEIQQIAAEVKEELSPEAPTDLEVMMEKPEAAEQPMYGKAIYEILHGKPALFRTMLAAETEDQIREGFIPLGEATYFVRLEGIGKVMVSMNAAGATFTAVRSELKETHGWDEISEEVMTIHAQGMTAEECWRLAFGGEVPEELIEKPEEPAKQEEPEKPKKKPEKKSRVEPTKKPEKKKTVLATNVKAKESEDGVEFTGTLTEEGKEFFAKAEETEEIAPVQILPMPEPTYKEQLWSQLRDYADLIRTATDTQEVRRCIQVIELTCKQIEEAADED